MAPETAQRLLRRILFACLAAALLASVLLLVYRDTLARFPATW